MRVVGIVIAGLIAIFVIGFLLLQKPNPTNPNNSDSTVSPTDFPTPTDEVYLGQQPTSVTSTEPCAGWTSQSDYDQILIKLNFAEGIEKDTSYETGFAFSSINRTARLARKDEYCTGFKFDELKNKGVVQVAVWGYSDNRRRQLANEPINITFDENGRPDVEGIIEVTVLD